MILNVVEKLVDEIVLGGAKYCYFFVDLVEFP